ncbi:MAG: polysaccharide lyase 6 family protein [Flavisolibacter sp.]
MKNLITIFLSLVLLDAAQRVYAATITVSSIADLQAAIARSVPGDVIILSKGIYSTGADITIDKKGTAGKPITIEGQGLGETELTGAGGFSIVSPAEYIIIKGFRFTHLCSKARTGSGTRFCQWTHNIFQNSGEGEYLTIAGDDHQIDYNTFQSKNTLGRFLAIRGTGNQIAQRLWIHHNYFYDFKRQQGNGAETLQFGLSGYSLSSSNSVVEYNLFEQCDGENELISVKASSVILRYNTIRDCPAQFTLRHGNRCLVYGNYFFNTPGLRIFGDDHVVFSNYFEHCNPAITVGNGDGEVADGAALTSHDRPDRVIIVYNTLVNNVANIIQQGRKDGLGATHISFANNLIQGGGKAAALSGPYTDGIWLNNILYVVADAGDIPSSGYKTLAPMLSRDAMGTFHLQKGSPLIDAGKGSFPQVTVDMDGQSRKGLMDIGADELSNDAAISHMLGTNEVGYLATEK